jgi:hypothetical protein
MLTFSRPKKLDHIDTVRYEIDMLRFAIQRLAEQKLTKRDAWSYLEVFLLHYRNLIDFLGGEQPSPNSTDLHVTTFWKLTSLTPPPKLDEIYAKGKVLRARYEPTNAQGGGRISQYLQHCTTKRTDAKDWPVTAMMNEIEPLLSEVEKQFGTHTGILRPVPVVQGLDMFSASTTVATFTAAGAVFIEDTLRKPKDFE